MKFPKIFRNRKKKSCTNNCYPNYAPLMIGLHNQLVSTGNVDIAAAYSGWYYKQVQPLFDAIERIASALGSIKAKIWDNEKETWAQHTVLDLLLKPDDDTVWSEFFSNSARWMMLTGNIEWLAGGNINKPPLELRIVHPQHVVIQPSANDPYPLLYQVSEPWGANDFIRIPKSKERQLRYCRRDNLLEIYHMKTFNPLSGALHGLSPLNSIYYEIEQYKALSIHNLAAMKNGVTGGLIIKTESSLTADQKTRLASQINQMYAGEANAGKTMILEGGMDVENFGKNNKEMDYVKLRKSILDGIYSTFKIPLPMVSADRMTLSNYSVSQLMLYDHTIEHYANRIFEELTRFLMPRYGDTENRYDITYNPREISALETRRNEQVKLLNTIGKNTPNELRQELGFEERDEKGMDKIYMQTNVYPIEDEIKTEEKPKEETIIEEEEKSYIQNFKSILKSYKQKNKRLFSDNEIENLSKEI